MRTLTSERHVFLARVQRIFRRCLAQQGQSLAEIALMLPVILLTMMGAIEIGRVAYASIEVCTAARAGVAYGAENETNAANTSGMEQAALNDVNLTGMTASASSACKCSNGSATSCLSNTCSSGEHLEEYVSVSTSYSMHSLFKYPGIPQTYTLSGYQTMRVRQ